MSRFHHHRTICLLPIAWLALTVFSQAQTHGRISTRFLARGEQALLEISVSGTQPAMLPEIPPVKGVDIRPAGTGPRPQLMPGRKMEYIFDYLVSSYETGNHVIPAITVTSGGFDSKTEPIEFTVFNPDDLQWSETSVGTTQFRYASAFRVMKPNPYEGETIPVEIKIFIPRDLFVEDYGIPDFQRDGVTAWRFQPTAMRGQINLLGMPYVSVAYPSTLTPTRSGKVGIGPASIRLVTTQVVMDGILRRVSKEVNLSVPKLELDSRPLPPGAPEGFENAVGNFKLDVTAAVTDLHEGDPVPIEMVIRGTGNLDTLRPPKPADASGWKLYDAAPAQRGDERRELSGTAVFQQFMRPLEFKPNIPSFRLVFFDPKDESYKTVTTEPIRIQMKPAVAPPPAAIQAPQAKAVPVERMTDILGLLQPATPTITPRTKTPTWLGHAIAVFLALCLVARALWLRNAHHFQKDPEKSARLKALREIEQTKNDAKSFLMAAGHFIEQWLGNDPSPEIRDILTERDQLCFRPDDKANTTLDANRRNSIIRTLRKAVLPCIIATIALLPARSMAADPSAMAVEAYDSARYDEAISHWLKAGSYDELSPDLLYNIGNACYRAGSPGYAALYYRRALTRDAGHQESRQNLHFIERKYGSITIHRPEYQYAIASFPLAAWQGALWSGIWLFTLALLVFPATRPGARLRLVAFTALVIAPLIATGGALGWHYFPNDAEFAPPHRQAIIVSENAILHTDASRTSPEVIDAPPGSLCEVIQQSGRWTYVAFASKTRGWIPTESIETIIPRKPPSPPKIHKPKADDKSA